MHESVKHFSQHGIIKDDKDFIRLRLEFERIIIDVMKSTGYLPIYNMGSHWSTEWLGDRYTFRLTMYGSYAGKKKAQDYTFWLDGRLIKDG